MPRRRAEPGTRYPMGDFGRERATPDPSGWGVDEGKYPAFSSGNDASGGNEAPQA